MKKKSSPNLDDDLRPEYGEEFFRDMKPNRFAFTDLKFNGMTRVYLDDDVAEVFNSSESVNTVLRSAIRAMQSVAPTAKTSGEIRRKVTAPKRKRAS